VNRPEIPERVLIQQEDCDRVSAWARSGRWSGFVYVAFVVDVFSRRIVGWPVSSSRQTGLVLDAFRHALDVRQRGDVRWAAHLGRTRDRSIRQQFPVAPAPGSCEQAHRRPRTTQLTEPRRDVRRV
jgi:hypothetical protein